MVCPRMWVPPFPMGDFNVVFLSSAAVLAIHFFGGNPKFLAGSSLIFGDPKNAELMSINVAHPT